jgi:hypothetical protein
MSNRKRQAAQGGKPQPILGSTKVATGGRSSFHDLYLQKLHRIKQGLGVGDAQDVHSIPAVGEGVIEPITLPDLEAIPEVAASRSQKDLIWEEALANKDYYEAKALEDDLKKPWFRYPKKRTQYGEFVFLTPEMAEELLRYNPDNRNLKPQLVQAYRRDIENDCWVPSHEGIGVNLSQNMFDGQHRAVAICEANKGWPIWIVFNVLDEAKFTTDSGAKRDDNEKLRMVVDKSLGNRTNAFIKALMRGTSARIRFSTSEVAAFAVKWQHIIEWIANNVPNVRADVQAAIAKGVMWYGEEKLIGFCTRYKQLQFNGDGDPAKALYKFLANKPSSGLEIYKKTVAAVTALMENKTVAKLYEQDEDVFHWLPGWDVPPGAPKDKAKV